MNHFLLKESVLLALLPVLSFAGALLFEMGYASEFGYSYSFISVDLKSMVVSLACAVVVLMPIVLFVVAVFRVMLDKSKEVRVLGLEFFLPVLALIAVCITGFRSPTFLILFVSSLGFAVSKYSVVLFRARKYGFKGALSRAADLEGLTDRAVVREILARIDFKNSMVFYFLLVLVFVVLALMVRGIGQGVAHWKSDYHTFKMDGDEYAIISVYDDLVVLGGVYEDQFNGVISVIPKNSEKLTGLRSAYLPTYLPGVCAIGGWGCEE